MITRRQTLSAVASSLLAPAFELTPFSANASVTLTRNTDVACQTCVTSEDLRNSYTNILDSAHIIKHVSLPTIVRPILRSSKVGVPVQFVESVTGKLGLSLKDLTVRGAPSVMIMRYELPAEFRLPPVNG